MVWRLVRVMLIMLCSGVCGCAALNPWSKPSLPTDGKPPSVKEEDLSQDRSNRGDGVGRPAAPLVPTDPMTGPDRGPLIPVVPPKDRPPRRIPWTDKKRPQPGSKPFDE